MTTPVCVSVGGWQFCTSLVLALGGFAGLLVAVAAVGTWLLATAKSLAITLAVRHTIWSLLAAAGGLGVLVDGLVPGGIVGTIVSLLPV